MTTIQIAANAIRAKIINPTREVKLLASNELSFEVDGAEFSGKFKQGGWSGISSLFKMTTCTFPMGFVPRLTKALKEKGFNVQLIAAPVPPPLGDPNPKVDNFPDDPRYNYQMETVRKLEQYKVMVAMVSTGGGKTRVAKLAYRRIGRMTLFLTTRSVLMYQMKSAFNTMGEPVGVVGDGVFSPKRGFNVGMVQTFVAMLKSPEKQALAKALLAKFEFVILEEAHEVGGNGYYDVVNQCKNAYYRLALTGTPFMKDNEESNMRLRAVAGEVRIRVTEKYLIDNGILATPYFKFINTEKPKLLFKGTNWRSAYRIGIVENEHRNKAIVFEAERAAKYKMKTIILVQHKAHGEILKRMLSGAGIRCLFMYGENSQSERSAALSGLKSGKLEVLIGSTILDVGVDVPAVGMIILAGGFKEEVGLRQRIGRGLREKFDMGNVSFIVDFTDSHNKHLRGHSELRRSIIESIDGFKQGIIKTGEDFDFKKLEKR